MHRMENVLKKKEKRKVLMSGVCLCLSETKLHVEVYTCRTYQSCVIRQVQPQWRMVGKFL